MITEYAYTWAAVETFTARAKRGRLEESRRWARPK